MGKRKCFPGKYYFYRKLKIKGILLDLWYFKDANDNERIS